MSTTSTLTRTATIAPTTAVSAECAIVSRVATAALQSRTVGVERLAGYLHRTYRLRNNDKFFYLLRTRPSPDVRLLRLEDGSLLAEAAALHAMTGRSTAEISIPRLIESEFYPNPAHSSTTHSRGADTKLGMPYLISGPFVGSVLADVEPSLSSTALATIDASLGRYVRSLATITGPRFGFVRPAQATAGSSSSAPAPASGSFESWSIAFAFLLETLLRDAEDKSLALPYDKIRNLVRQHRASLDKITVPRLTLLELSSDTNVAVDLSQSRVTGLLDFSSAVWGDPFMSDCFYRPTASFAQGFGRLPNEGAEERARQYLYVLYHSLLAVVRGLFRPGKGAEVLEKEREARRNLGAAMSWLEGWAKS